jgi:tetratricopeptide (TPR) repeat protein
VLISLQLANLGLAYWLQGNNELASSTLKKGLKDREDEFGKEDRVSFITGRFLHALGNVESSLDYHRRALMHYKLTLGNRHHRTADVFVKVAEHHIKLGNYDMALALLNHALGAFSISHTYIPEKMRACWMRSKALSALGKTDEAESELANCYQVYVRLRSKREGDGPKIKDRPSELDDEDIDDLIVFWSK